MYHKNLKSGIIILYNIFNIYSTSDGTTLLKYSGDVFQIPKTYSVTLHAKWVLRLLKNSKNIYKLMNTF